MKYVLKRQTYNDTGIILNQISMGDKTNIGKAVTMGQLLEFNVAFPNEQPLLPEQYLIGGSRSIILNVAAFFLGFKSYNSKFNDNRELFKVIFGPKNMDFAQEVLNNIAIIEKKGTRVGIINSYSSLKLFEYFFEKKDEPETQSHEEFERNLFKALFSIKFRIYGKTKSSFYINRRTR